jgi:hypothetical protein
MPPHKHKITFHHLNQYTVLLHIISIPPIFSYHSSSVQISINQSSVSNKGQTFHSFLILFANKPEKKNTKTHPKKTNKIKNQKNISLKNKKPKSNKRKQTQIKNKSKYINIFHYFFA